MPLVFVLNGPNLNMLGVREPGLYGTHTLEDVRELCRAEGSRLHLDFYFRQTNHEATLLDWVHESHGKAAAIVLNAAALARTSLVLHDAVNAVKTPVIEVHITNIHSRASYRPPSYLSRVAHGVISGFGILVYPMALRAVHSMLNEDRRAEPIS
jgi:3-dehydroquinate dehydratase-2